MGKVREKLYPHHNVYADFTPLPFNSHSWDCPFSGWKGYLEEIKPSLIVEVGTWFGGSSRAIVTDCVATGLTDFEVVCVDTFLGSFEHWNRTSYLMTLKNGRPNVYEQFLSNVLHSNQQNFITPFPIDSINAYEYLKWGGFAPDMIYIDAGHDHDSVKVDLENWSSLLRDGGIMIMDDAHHPPIIQAVGEVLGNTVVKDGGKFVWRKPVKEQEAKLEDFEVVCDE